MKTSGASRTRRLESTSTSQTVSLESHGESLNYDILVLAVGGITNYAGVEGAEEFSFPFRKLAHADDLRRANGRRARSHSSRHAAPGRTS